MQVRPLWARLLTAALILGLLGVVAEQGYRRTRPDYRLRAGLEALQRADLDAAEEIVRQLESTGAKDHANLLQAIIDLDLARPNAAVVSLNKIEAIPQRIEGAGRYGEWLVRHHRQPAEAERMFRFVLSHKPDELLAHRCLAALYYDQGAWALAVQHAIRWSELDEADGRPLRFMGLIYKDMDHPTPAIPCYREALRRELHSTVRQEVKEELAECLTTKSQYEEALEILLDCGPRAKQVPQLIALEAECLVGLGRTAEAIPLLDRALEKPQVPSELLRVRGKIYVAEGKFEQGAGLFERAIQQDPHDIASRYQLSLAYERLKKPEEAARHRATMEKTREGMQVLTKLIQDAGEKPWDTALQKKLAEQCEKMDRPDLAKRWHRAASAGVVSAQPKSGPNAP